MHRMPKCFADSRDVMACRRTMTQRLLAVCVLALVTLPGALGRSVGDASVRAPALRGADARATLRSSASAAFQVLPGLLPIAPSFTSSKKAPLRPAMGRLFIAQPATRYLLAFSHRFVNICCGPALERPMTKSTP